MRDAGESDARNSVQFPDLAKDLEVDYPKCSKTLQGRRVGAPTDAVAKERAGAPERSSGAREPAPPARSSLAAGGAAIPPGSVLVMKLLTAVDAKTRNGTTVRAALQQPLLVDGTEIAPEGAIFGSATGSPPIAVTDSTWCTRSRRILSRSAHGACGWRASSRPRGRRHSKGAGRISWCFRRAPC
jgi:hypothetical protein